MKMMRRYKSSLSEGMRIADLNPLTLATHFLFSTLRFSPSASFSVPRLVAA